MQVVNSLMNDLAEVVVGKKTECVVESKVDSGTVMGDEFQQLKNAGLEQKMNVSLKRVYYSIALEIQVHLFGDWTWFGIYCRSKWGL